MLSGKNDSNNIVLFATKSVRIPVTLRKFSARVVLRACWVVKALDRTFL